MIFFSFEQKKGGPKSSYSLTYNQSNYNFTWYFSSTKRLATATTNLFGL